MQDKGDVLAGVNFATDGGTEHAMVPLKDGLLKAKDLRLRFEWGGAAASVSATTPNAASAQLQFDKVRFHLSVPFATFAGEKPRWETGTGKGATWLDLALYSGPEQTFHLGEIEQAAIGFALRVSTEDALPPQVNTQVENGFLKLRLEKLALEVPVKPAPIEAQHRVFRTEK